MTLVRVLILAAAWSSVVAMGGMIIAAYGYAGFVVVAPALLIGGMGIAVLGDMVSK